MRIMERLRGEYVYTRTGRMRPVFLSDRCREACFSLEMAKGDRARVEVSFDPRSVLEKGRARWFPFEGGDGGGVQHATALRVVVEKLEDWMSLIVQQEMHDDE